MSRRALSTFNSSTLSTLRRVSIPRSHARVSESSCPTCSSRWTTASPTPPRRFMSWSSTRLAPTLEQTPLHSPAVTQVPPPPPLRTSPSSAPAVTKPKARVVKPRKSAITLSSTAVDRIRSLLDSPEPKLIRIGVRNKGCAGMSYHLEYVDRPDRFDEVVEQDGVKVVIDSKALFSIIGSTMDWQEDALQAKFVFNNPNIKDACGCGESFIV